MSAVPSAESVRVSDRGYTGHISMPPASAPRRRRTATGRPAAKAGAAIGRIQALMREHSIALSELGVAYALHRIGALMRKHSISIDELRGQAATPREVPVTRCPSMNHDPRYQLPPDARVVGPFTAEWNQLRGGRR